MKIQVFALVFSILILPSAEAQLSKQEKKQWKKEAKNYMKQPENLKLLMDQKAYSDGEAKKLKGELGSVKEELEKKDDQIVELEELVSRMRVDAAVTKAELEKFKAGMVAGGGAPANTSVKKQPASNQGDLTTGVVFKVQVGAFKNKDLSKYFDNNPNFGGEAGKEPTDPQRINIGIFRNYWEADKFKKYLREMGVKDAWIVPYRDGTRIEIRDVLDMIVTTENPQD